MKNILLSIKPKYAELILSGKKTIELRKSVPKEEVEWVYLYATAPVKKIVGRIKVVWFLNENSFSFKDLLDRICVTETEFKNYVGDKPYSLWIIDQKHLQRCSMELSEFYIYCGDNPTYCGKCDCFYECSNESYRSYECMSRIECHRQLKHPPQSWCYVEDCI